LQGLGAQAGGGFFDFTRNIGQHRLHGAHHKRQGDEGQCQGDAHRRVGNLETQVGGELADPAVGRVQGGQGDTGHGGRQGKRQVDHGIDDLAPGEGVAHQDPGQYGADHTVDDGCHKGGAETQLQRCQHPGGGDDGPELVPGQLSGMHKHRSQRDQHNQTEIHQGVAQCQPEAGYDGGDTTRHKSPWLTHEARNSVAGSMF